MSDGKRRVVCAAIRAADGSLLLGIRHYSRDMHEQIAMRADGHKFRNRLDEDQGFVDQHCQWMDRREAFNVALDARQITDPTLLGRDLNGNYRLYSEALY